MARKRTRRRKRAGNYPLQMALAATLVALSTWMTVMIVEKAVHPYWLGHKESRKVDELRAELAEQDARNAVLRKQIGYLQTDEGAEVLARRSGYRRPGEVVLLLRETPPAGKERGNGR